jgi:hypothetical protein
VTAAAGAACGGGCGCCGGCGGGGCCGGRCGCRGRGRNGRLQDVGEEHVGHALGERRGVDRAEVAQRRDGEALLGEAHQLRAVAAPRTAVAHRPQASIAGVAEAERVVDGVAAGQAAALVQRIQQCRPADFRVVEVVVPVQQLLHGGEDCAIAELQPPRHVGTDAAVVERCVGEGAVGYHVVVAAEIVRALHPEGLEDALAGEVAERLAGHTLDDDGEQEVARVAVEVLVARGEVQLPLPHDGVQRIFGVVTPSMLWPPRVSRPM